MSQLFRFLYQLSRYASPSSTGTLNARSQQLWQVLARRETRFTLLAARRSQPMPEDCRLRTRRWRPRSRAENGVESAKREVARNRRAADLEVVRCTRESLSGRSAVGHFGALACEEHDAEHDQEVHEQGCDHSEDRGDCQYDLRDEGSQLIYVLSPTSL